VTAVRSSTRGQRSLLGRALGAAGPIGAASLVGTLAWVALDPTVSKRAAFACLVASLWVLSIAVGALVWLVLGYLIGARWQVELRRLTSLLIAPLPWLGVCAVPILLPVALGSSLVYPWVGKGGEDMGGRVAYLSPAGFVARGAIYFLVWNVSGFYFRSRSRLLELCPPPDLARTLRRASAPTLGALVLTLTFAAIDWVMSLDPAWTSSIFGLYFCLGCVVAALAAVVLLTAAFAGHERLVRVLTPGHYRDLGRSLFTFVLLWAYVAFCQLLLVWYADLPTETAWLGRRLMGHWRSVSVVLVLGHWAAPMFGLMSRASKERPRILVFWAAWLLGAHYIDLCWLVMPELSPSGSPIGLVDLGCLLGLGGGYVALVVRAARRAGLLPAGDGRLATTATVDQA
jgi:hypothetical protein